MRITIEDTTDFHEGRNPKMTYELPYDDLTIDDMIEAFRAILLARTFPESTVNEYLGEE